MQVKLIFKREKRMRIFIPTGHTDYVYNITWSKVASLWSKHNSDSSRTYRPATVERSIYPARTDSYMAL